MTLDVGFKAIKLQDLSLQEEVQLLIDASFVVCASGAAWAHIFFAEQIKGLSWFPELCSQACTYSNLAGHFDHNLYFLPAKPYREIKSTGSAPRVGYEVAPDAFRQSLVEIL